MSQDYSPGPFFPGGHYPLLRHICGELKPAGTALEFGVSNGSSLRIIAEHMPAVGFDSFAGLPEAGWRGYPLGMFAHKPPVIANTRLVIGMFDQTLPRFAFDTVDPIGLVHLDCDLYSSTGTVLHYLQPHLKSGCYIVLDDYWEIAVAETAGAQEFDGERAQDEVSHAWREFTEHSDIEWKVIGCTGGAWAIQLV
jgi:hypothetical protein